MVLTVDEQEARNNGFIDGHQQGFCEALDKVSDMVENESFQYSGIMSECLVELSQRIKEIDAG